MYFPIGWPKVLNTPEFLDGRNPFLQICTNREKVLFALLTAETITIWFIQPCVPIVYHRRTLDSVQQLGTNVLMEWKPDSSMIVIATSEGHLIYYDVGVLADSKGVYVQTDSPQANLRRDSAELFIKETIPPLHLSIAHESMLWDGAITSIVCITTTEIMVATTKNHILRYRWDGMQNRDYSIDLRRTPFCINQQVSKAMPIVEDNTYVSNMEYSPLVGGFAITLNDGRAAFLTASSLKFDPNQVQGIWAQGIEDATCATVNHKYRLITFGRQNSQCVVYYVDESTGGLEMSHSCVLSSKDYPGNPGAVERICWSPDGCAMVASWEKGGIAVWSTFGALLMCTLGWDYGLHVDLTKANPLLVTSMDWSTEGYQLCMIRKHSAKEDEIETSGTSVIVMEFVKSALTVNPCMSRQTHLYLQGPDRLYLNLGDTLQKVYSERPIMGESVFVGETNMNSSFTNLFVECRQWVVISLPDAYSSTNWPIRYSAIDYEGQHMAVAGRTGLAHYSLASRRWKLFGNESQEKDFVVTGGLLWWKDFLIMGSYSFVDNSDELRLYAREAKLDNKFGKIIKVPSQVLLLNNLQDQLITFYADAKVAIYHMSVNESGNVDLQKIQAVDISSLSVHPACVVSVTLTSLRTESGNRFRDAHSENIVLNVSGRLLLVQREQAVEGNIYTCAMPSVLASCVENVWVPGESKPSKPHLTEALWLFCGSHGMRVWLPLFPREGDKGHNFMSKRIMLPFQLKIYPLAISFEDAIILGAENDTVLYTNDSKSPFSLPFCVLKRTSQVYLHQILRQLIRRNLGYHAWEIVSGCTYLPYFSHSLELLLHEVLEEEATSKEPIPDAQLPSVIDFISEFPVYLQTVVQCARKTEIALWPYLFSVAGKPKNLFQECIAKKELETAASYLIILQNLEASSVSRQYATLLLDTALEECEWELAKDLVRFLKAIDPNDVESPRNSFVLSSKFGMSQQTPPVSPNADDLSLILSSVPVARGRSFSTTVTPKMQAESVSQKSVASPDSPLVHRKKSAPSQKTESRDASGSAEEFFIDVILQRHARRLLSSQRLLDLGYFAAHLDFHLVTWLAKERNRAAKIENFVTALKALHKDFSWPLPSVQNGTRKASNESESPVIEDRMKLLKIDTGATESQVGDSGYMSFSRGLPFTDLVTPVVSDTGCSVSINNSSGSEMTQVMEAPLVTQYLRDNRRQMSTTSSLWGTDEIENLAVSPDSWNDVPSTLMLEQISAQINNKGDPRSEVQLRYLLQLFMEAGCLDWSLLISIVLCDAMAVLRIVNVANSPDHSIEAVHRLKQGLQMLSYWTSRECLGYQNFMVAIQHQIVCLNKIIASKQLHQQCIEEQELLAQQKKSASPVEARIRRTSSNQESNHSDKHHHHHHHLHHHHHHHASGSGGSSSAAASEANNSSKAYDARSPNLEKKEVAGGGGAGEASPKDNGYSTCAVS